MSQITHFCGVKLLAWYSGCVKFWTNIMSEFFLLQNIFRFTHYSLKYNFPREFLLDCKQLSWGTSIRFFNIYHNVWEKSAGITKKYLLVNTLSNYFRTVSDRKNFSLCLWWIPFYSPPPPPLSFRRNILFQNLISFTSMWSRWPTLLPCFWFHR